MGNVRRQGERLIVSATLYETDDDRTIWSQQFDRPDRDDEWKAIIRQIYINFRRAANDAEVARAMREHPDSLDKRDLMMAANATSLAGILKQNYLARIALIERALAIDPDDVAALEAKARVYASLLWEGFSSDPGADLAERQGAPTGTQRRRRTEGKSIRAAYARRLGRGSRTHTQGARDSPAGRLGLSRTGPDPDGPGGL
jgi:hypothetical protein